MTQAQRNGKKLAELRGDLKQEYIAKVLNISASAISMYETGKRTPRDEIKKAFAKYYGTTVEKLFYE
jgi:Predicted transcriptional regulators